MNTDKRKYDLIFSLGGNCTVASQLQLRKLRLFSLPFDWVYFENERAIDYLTEGFSDHFQNLALRENLSKVSTNKSHPVTYFDEYSGYFFPNHFKRFLDEEDTYQSFYETLLRRINRLYQKINESKKVCCILATAVPISDDKINKFQDKLKSLFNETQFDICVVKFNASEDSERNVGNILFKNISRNFNLYDFTRTNFDWAFLDTFSLSPASSSYEVQPKAATYEVQPKAATLRKRGITYKIWKHLYKKLVKKGVINEYKYR